MDMMGMMDLLWELYCDDVRHSDDPEIQDVKQKVAKAEKAMTDTFSKEQYALWKKYFVLTCKLECVLHKHAFFGGMDYSTMLSVIKKKQEQSYKNSDTD